MKVIPVGKELQRPLFIDDMKLRSNNPENLAKIIQICKVAGYKISMQKEIVREQTQNEIMKTIPFARASKRIKYLEIKLTKWYKIYILKIKNIVQRN